MATVLERLLDTGTLSTRVYNITKKTSDAAAAAGYGAWVESVTGSYPTVADEAGTAVIQLSAQQQVDMRRWIERQMFVGRDSDASLQIEFARVVNPLVVKYAVILLAAGFMGGFFARGVWR